MNMTCKSWDIEYIFWGLISCISYLSATGTGIDLEGKKGIRSIFGKGLFLFMFKLL